PAWGDAYTGLHGLAEADFVRKDTTTLAQTPKRENHGVDLVWVWIDSRLTLGCRIALAVVGSADPHKILGKHPEIEVVERHRSSSPRSRRHGSHHRRVRVAIKCGLRPNTTLHLLRASVTEGNGARFHQRIFKGSRFGKSITAWLGNSCVAFNRRPRRTNVSIRHFGARTELAR